MIGNQVNGIVMRVNLFSFNKVRFVACGSNLTLYRGNEESAFGFGIDVSFCHKLPIRVFNRDNADAVIACKCTFGWQLFIWG